MTNDLETMLRSSLRQRAEDVEPTPELWRRVEREVSRPRVLPLVVWTAAAAGAAAVAVGVATLPGLLDGVERGIQVDPDPVGQGTDAPPADDPVVVPAATPSHYLAATDDRLVLRAVDGSGETTLLEFDGESRLETFAVRPGSSPTDFAVAFVTSAEGMHDLGLVQRRPGPGGSTVSATVNGNIAPGLQPGDPAPTPVWSPDGATIAWAGRDVDGTPRLQLLDVGETMAAATVDGGGAPTFAAARTFALSGESEAARLRLQNCAVSAGTCGQLRLQDWARTSDGQRLAFTAEGLLLETRITPTSDGWALERDGVLTEPAPDEFVVDVATAPNGDTYRLSAGGVTAQDAEDAGLRLVVGDTEVGFPDLFTADPAAAWMTAVEGGAVVGLGDQARLVLRDDAGLQVRPVDAPTRYAAFLPVAGTAALDPAPAVTPTAGPGAAAAALGPQLAVDAEGRLLLRADGTEELLYPDDTVSAEAGVAVQDVSIRPGSTPDDITAVALLATEGGPELVALSYREGDLAATAMQGPHGIGADADFGRLRAPVWDPGGDHLAWVERGGDGSWTLRTIGWDEGPGTGRSADDNAGFGLELAADDLALVDWIWGEGDGDGELTGSVFLVASGEPDGTSSSGLYRQDVVRQGDGALALTGAPVALEAPTEGQVLGVRLGEASATYLVRQIDGTAYVVFGGDVPIEVVQDVPAELLRLSGTHGEPVVSAGDKAFRVLADGTVESVGPVRDLEFVPFPG
jgi:hypothetical protein